MRGLWDKFGMREVVEEKCETLYVGLGHHHKAMACVSHEGRYASYGRWKATSALAKGEYRLSSSGGIPRARARARRRKTFSTVSVAAITACD